MPEDVKQQPTQPSFDDILNGFSHDVSKSVNIAGAGQAVQFEGKDVSRYMTYGTKTFGKLGYDPVKGSQKLDEIYNNNTHWSKDLDRAYRGMWKLAGVGFKDTFSFGALSGSDAHKEFDKVMQDYSSTRGGATQFIANTGLSAGYTVGIMSAIAFEEGLLTLATGGLGLLATGGEVSRGLLNISKGLKKAEQFRYGKAVEQMSQIKNARMVKEPGFFKNFIQQVVPGGDTYDFLRNADQLEDLNKFQQAFTGAASLARDARKIHMTMAESKLEGNLAKDEYRNAAISKWYKDNPGGKLSSDELAKIDEKAEAIYKGVFSRNAALIHLSNAITFGTMFRSMRLTNKMFNLDEAGKFAVKNFGTKDVLVEALEQNVQNYFKRKASQISVKGSLKWLGESSMEGLQEVSQDLISSAYSDYYAGDDKVRGSWYNSILAGLGDMHLESFASGMLMGTFASPVGFAIEQSQNFLLKGGHTAITDPEAFEKRKAATYKELKEDAKFLTEYFQATGTHLMETEDASFVMAKAQEEMAEAATENDRKKFEDKRRDVFRRGMKTIMKHGLESQYIEHLEQLKEHSAAELNESLQRTDITEENKSQFISKIDKKINDIKSFKERFDRAQQEINPISKTSLAKLDPTDPLTFQKKIQHLAFEKYRDEMMFTEDAVYDLGERMEALEKEVVNENFTSKDLATILSKKDLSQEITLLEERVKSNKEYDVNPTETAKAERKLNAYKELQEAMTAYDELTNLTGSRLTYKTEAAYDKLFEAFNNFVTANADVESTPARRVENKRAFDKVWDYMINNTERNNLQDTLNLLRDPERAKDYLAKSAQVLEEIDANKEQHILKSLEEFETFRTSEVMMDELLENGLFFDLREIDDLMKNDIMPSNIYNADTHKPATQKELLAAQKIIKRYHKNLKGEYLLKGKEQSYASRKKLKGDKRTDQEILDEYGASANTPMPVSVFLRRLMLNGKSATITEREIANALANSDLGITDVVLSTELDKPVEIKDGQLHIDIRFSASNFRNDNTPFEYMAVSGLLQAHFQAKLESDPELAQQTQELMEKARDAYIKKFDDQKGAKLDLFTNKAVFLSESLNNVSFQAFLAEVEDTEEVTTKSLWEAFLDGLRKTLKELFKDEGTLLTRAMNIATYALDENLIEQVTAQQTPVAEVKEEAPVEEEPVVSTSEEVEKLQEQRDDKLEEIDNQIDELAAQLAALEAEEEVEESIDAIRKQLADLQAQRNQVEADYNKSVEGLNIDEPAQTRSEKNNKERIQNRIEEIQKEKIALEGKKGMFSFGVKRQLSALAVEEQELRVELDQLGRVEVAPRKPVEPKFEDNTPVEKVENEDGSVEITIYTPFTELPLDLQELLAQEYYKTDGPKQKFERDSSNKTPIEKAANTFENPITSNDGPPSLRRNQLTEEDVKIIQNRMQHNGYYMEIVGAYRRTKLNPSKRTQAEITAQKTQIAKAMAGRLINKMPATDIVMRSLLDETDFDFYKANKIEIQDEARALFAAMMKGQAPIVPGKGNLLSVVRVEDLLVLVDNIRDVYDDNQIKEFVQEINKLKNEQERLGRIRELEIEVAQELAEEDVYEKIDLNNLVPGALMILSEEEADQILGLLNAGTATVEEFVKFVEAKKKEQEDTQDQEKLEQEAANLESNTKLYAELVSGFKISIDTGKGGKDSKRRYKAKSFSPLFIKLFLERNPEILKASPKEFREALNSFYNNGLVKATNIRKLGFDLEKFGAGKTPYYQLLKYKESLITAGYWNEDVIKAINFKLKEYGIDLSFKNQSEKYTGDMKSIFTRSLITPVETKRRTIKKKKPAVKKIEKSVDYYLSNIQPDVLSKEEAVAILYDWLKDNNIHPDTINIPGADYISKKDSIQFNKPDELAEEIFKNYLVQLESLGGPGVIEELLNEFDEKADMLNYLDESLDQEESDQERQEREAREREEYEKEKYEEYLAESNAYYNSVAFLLENGLYEGDAESLSEAERKVYNKNRDKYLEEPTPSEIYIEAVALNEELAKQSDQDSLNAYVEKVLNTIEQEAVTANELVAVYKIADRHQQRFTKDQKTILQDTVLERLEDVNFVNEVVKLNNVSDLYRLKRIVKEGPSPAVAYLENIRTGQIEAIDFNDFLLEQVEEFLPEGSIYIPEDSPADISDENGKLYKEAYSEVFATFMQSMTEMEDLSMPVIKAEIKEEMEKCNGYKNRF